MSEQVFLLPISSRSQEEPSGRIDTYEFSDGTSVLYSRLEQSAGNGAEDKVIMAVSDEENPMILSADMFRYPFSARVFHTKLLQSFEELGIITDTEFSSCKAE
jgi:hypothetical protein